MRNIFATPMTICCDGPLNGQYVPSWRTPEGYSEYRWPSDERGIQERVFIHSLGFESFDDESETARTIAVSVITEHKDNLVSMAKSLIIKILPWT